MSQLVATTDIINGALQDLAMENFDMAARSERIQPPLSQKSDSQCLICSKIFYGQTPNKCSKCGGAIVTYGQGLVSHRYAGRDGW